MKAYIHFVIPPKTSGRFIPSLSKTDNCSSLPVLLLTPRKKKKKIKEELHLIFEIEKEIEREEREIAGLFPAYVIHRTDCHGREGGAEAREAAKVRGGRRGAGGGAERAASETWHLLLPDDSVGVRRIRRARARFPDHLRQHRLRDLHGLPRRRSPRPQLVLSLPL